VRSIASVFVAAAFAAATASAATAVTISRFGTYTLARLGVTTQTLTASSLGRQVVVHYTLPAGTKEGSGHWFIVHVHATVELDPAAKGYGEVTVSGAGYGSVSVVFKDAGGGSVRWETVGILDGAQTHVTRGRRVELRLANVLPYGAVHPGGDALVFSVEQPGASGPIRSWTLHDDSSLEYTKVGPALLKASLAHPVGPAQTGHRVVATLRLHNAGDRPVRRIRISAVLGTPGLRVIGPSVRRPSALPAGATAFESFALEPLEPRSHRVFFLVSSTANHPGVELNFRATGPVVHRRAAPRTHRSGGSTWIAIPIGGVAVLVALVAAGLVIRRRSS
jgi:hypothetical protein